MHENINVKSPNNISEWQMGFNSAFKGLTGSGPTELSRSVQQPVFTPSDQHVKCLNNGPPLVQLVHYSTPKGERKWEN